MSSEVKLQIPTDDDEVANGHKTSRILDSCHIVLYM